MRAQKQLPLISDEEITPTISLLLEIIQQQTEKIQILKDEIAILKGQKPKPKIKPSNVSYSNFLVINQLIDIRN